MAEPGGSGTNRDSTAPSFRVRISQLPRNATEFSVLRLVQARGAAISDFHFPVHRRGDRQGRTVGHCFINVASEAQAEALVARLHGQNFAGARLSVRREAEQPGGGAARRKGGAAAQEAQRGAARKEKERAGKEGEGKGLSASQRAIRVAMIEAKLKRMQREPLDFG